MDMDKWTHEQLDWRGIWTHGQTDKNTDRGAIPLTLWPAHGYGQMDTWLNMLYGHMDKSIGI